eukprot:TRINITY_DN27714_c0_g1_i2.p1 TRINITY_DN27714_c0_g1~~TRINITY_DN27714_c0_g1_i2.p1  ORF type:complete len:625 (-),score=130.90 TRINITY_DN27714_c0_g1_i2:229-2103(-)
MVVTSTGWDTPNLSREEMEIVRNLQAKLRKVQQKFVDTRAFVEQTTAVAEQMRRDKVALTDEQWRDVRLAEGLEKDIARSRRCQRKLADRLAASQRELLWQAEQAEKRGDVDLVEHQSLQEEVRQASSALAEQRAENEELQLEVAKASERVVQLPAAPIGVAGIGAPPSSRSMASSGSPSAYSLQTYGGSSPRGLNPARRVPPSSTAASATTVGGGCGGNTAVGRCSTEDVKDEVVLSDRSEEDCQHGAEPSDTAELQESEAAPSSRESTSALGNVSGVASVTTTASHPRIVAFRGGGGGGGYSYLTEASRPQAVASPSAASAGRPRWHSTASANTAMTQASDAGGSPESVGLGGSSSPVRTASSCSTRTQVCSEVTGLIRETERLEAEVRRERERKEGLDQRLQTLRVRGSQLEAVLRRGRALRADQLQELRREVECSARQTRSLLDIAAPHARAAQGDEAASSALSLTPARSSQAAESPATSSFPTSPISDTVVATGAATAATAGGGVSPVPTTPRSPRTKPQQQIPPWQTLPVGATFGVADGVDGGGRSVCASDGGASPRSPRSIGDSSGYCGGGVVDIDNGSSYQGDRHGGRGALVDQGGGGVGSMVEKAATFVGEARER